MRSEEVLLGMAQTQVPLSDWLTQIHANPCQHSQPRTMRSVAQFQAPEHLVVLQTWESTGIHADPPRPPRG